MPPRTDDRVAGAEARDLQTGATVMATFVALVAVGRDNDRAQFVSFQHRRREAPGRPLGRAETPVPHSHF
jgi:hypothetical protein